MPVLSGRVAAVAAVLALVALVVPAPVVVTLAIVDGALLVLLAVDVVLAPSPGRVSVERRLAPAVALGGTTGAAWVLRCDGSRTIRVAVADALPPALGAQRRRFWSAVPPGRTSTVSTDLHPVRRGGFDLGPVTVRTLGPLGLAGRQHTRPLPGRVRVLPPMSRRQEVDLRVERARMLEVGLRSAAAHGGGTEFDSLRDYAVDDEFRRIDWAATARRGSPVVRTYRAERNQQVVVLLDAGRLMAGQVAGTTRLDHALDALIMLSALAARLDDRVAVVAFDRSVRATVPPRGGPGQLGRIVDAVFDVEPVLVASDYRRAFVEATSRWPRRSWLVLLTDLVPATATDTWLPALPLVARRHLVTVAATSDPAARHWAEAPVDHADDAYRRAAAVHARDERARLVSRLAGIGVRAVDAAPGRLAPELADAYLAVKATSRL